MCPIDNGSSSTLSYWLRTMWFPYPSYMYEHTLFPSLSIIEVISPCIFLIYRYFFVPLLVV